MPIPFETVPSDILLPLFYAEVTPAAEPISPSLRMLLIGHQNKANGADDGIAVPNTLNLLSRSDAVTLYGRGSMLAWMYEKARLNAPYAEIWGIAIDEQTSPAAVRATGKITVNQPGSKNRQGFARLWIGGRPVSFRVRETDLMPDIAIALRNAINSTALPVKASVASGTHAVDITSKWAGVTSNDIKIGYVGPEGQASSMNDSVQLARQITTITALSGGVGEFETANTFAAIGERPFDIIVFPWTSQNLYDKMAIFMGKESGRWSASQQLYGHAVSAYINSNLDLTVSGAGLVGLGESLNDPHLTVLSVMKSVCPNWEWAASLAAVMLTHWAAPPELSRPLQTLKLLGMFVGDTDDDSWIDMERNILLGLGYSTFHVNRDGTCAIDRVRTMRKYNDLGEPDPSWADAITMFQTQYFVRSMRRRITGAFPRSALTDVPMGIYGFTSVAEIRSVMIAEYLRLQSLGLVEHADLFSQFLVVERDTIDRNRVNALLRPDFVNQLRICAVLVETHLELDPTDPLLALGVGAAP